MFTASHDAHRLLNFSHVLIFPILSFQYHSTRPFTTQLTPIPTTPQYSISQYSQYSQHSQHSQHCRIISNVSLYQNMLWSYNMSSVSQIHLTRDRIEGPFTSSFTFPQNIYNGLKYAKHCYIRNRNHYSKRKGPSTPTRVRSKLSLGKYPWV